MRANPVLDRLGSYAIGELQNRVRQMRSEGRRLIDFSIGDPREPTPPFVAAVLRAAVAGYVTRRFGLDVDPDTQVLPTSGSKEAIFSTPLAFVDRDAHDAVIWPTPGYPIYQRGALMAGAVGHPVELGESFIFDPDQVDETGWERARIAWICSPHNPAGSVIPRGRLEALVERTRASNTLLCSDECYVDLYEGEPPASVLEVAGRASTGVLAFLSLSKRSGMTGYRSGAIVGDPEAIAILASFRTSTGTAQPEPTQVAAAAAWSDDDHVAERRRIFAAKRAILRRPFEEAGMNVVGSTAGIYLWVEGGDDVSLAGRLLEAGIVLSPGRVFGPGGEGHVRLALVPTLDECDEAAEALRKCL
jgi:acetylornithine aminotransferase